MSRHARTAPDPSLSPAERHARQAVRRLRRFYQHLTVFAVINAGLAALNLLHSPARLWFPWVLAGWGVWLALHAVGVFAGGRWLGADWEERKVRERLAARDMRQADME